MIGIVSKDYLIKSKYGDYVKAGNVWGTIKKNKLTAKKIGCFDL